MAKFLQKTVKSVCALCLSISAVCLGGCALFGDSSTGGNSSTNSGNSSNNSSSSQVQTKEYTVTFNANGGSVVEGATVEEGDVVVKPADPTKAYYTFGGWYNGETAWNFETDTVTANLTLTAKWIAKTYVVKFVDFDGNETEVTYTAETVAQFSLPAVPVAPAHHDNARWNKTLEECTVYSETEIVVEAIADPAKCTVTFVNGGEIDPVEVEYNDNIAATEATVRPGFIFEGWYFNGELYNFATPVTEEMTLVAKWYVPMGVGEKFEMNAEAIETGSTVETGYVSKNGVGEMVGGNGWYYDSDYITDWDGSLTERLLSHCVTFGVTADGGAGEVAEAIERTITLPVIDYTLYNKVDFGYTIGGNATKLTLCGTEVPTSGNKLVSIVEKDNGVYAVVREVNSPSYDLEIKLPDAVANGEEGITFVASVKGYTGFNVTEFHVTAKGKADYMVKLAEAAAKLPTAIEACNGNTDEILLFEDYLKYASYMTDYEKANYQAPEIVAAWLAKYGSKKVVINDLMANVQSNATYRADGLLLMNTASEYTFTLPAVNYAQYSECWFIARFGEAHKTSGYTFSAYGTTISAVQDKVWFYVKVITNSDGTYLTIYNTDVTSGTMVALPEAVANGAQGLTFTVTVSDSNYDWVKFWDDSQITSRMTGLLAE